tara:strand:+ start:447 stop:701 length:255 start_codon:yes stop_codon:yes gene_type:complete
LYFQKNYVAQSGNSSKEGSKTGSSLEFSCIVLTVTQHVLFIFADRGAVQSEQMAQVGQGFISTAIFSILSRRSLMRGVSKVVNH